MRFPFTLGEVPPFPERVIDFGHTPGSRLAVVSTAISLGWVAGALQAMFFQNQSIRRVQAPGPAGSIWEQKADRRRTHLLLKEL